MSEKAINVSEVNTQSVSTAFNQLKRIILAAQHLIAMFGATVLVPILTGMNSSVALVCAGIGTLIFHLCTKGKVPVFLGSSFAFIPVIISVGEIYGDLAYAQGGIMVAGMMYVLMSFIVAAIGVERVKSFFPSQVIGPMIVVIGLNLVPVAFSMASNNFMLAGVTLATALLITFFGKGFFKQLAIITAVIVGYVLSLKMGVVDMTPITSAGWFQMPAFTTPKFDIGAISIIAPVVLAVFMEHIGDITTNGTVVGKNFMEDPGLNRTLIGDGLATMVAGLLGGPANTTYGENTGVLAITKNYDPSILRITAVIAILLGTIGKVGGFLQSIPQAVMGGISLMLFSMISLIGFRTIRDSKIKMDIKNVVIMAAVLIIGLGGNVGINIAIPVTEQVSIAGLSLAALVGVILNKIIYSVAK